MRKDGKTLSELLWDISDRGVVDTSTYSTLERAMHRISNEDLNLKTIEMKELEKFRVMRSNKDYAIIEVMIDDAPSNEEATSWKWHEYKRVQLIHPYGSPIAYCIAEDMKPQ